MPPLSSSGKKIGSRAVREKQKGRFAGDGCDRRFAQGYKRRLRFDRIDPDTPLVPNGKRIVSGKSPDSELQLLSVETKPDQLIPDDSLITTAAYNLFWAFGLGWSSEKVQKWIQDTIPHAA